MDTKVLVALIGAAATVAAAIVATLAGHRRRATSSDNEKAGVVATAGRDISNSVIASGNVTLHETRLGAITQVFIDNLQVGAVTSPPSSGDVHTLHFLTEQAINYKSYSTGLALSFSLRNGHQENILVHSMSISLRAFYDATTTEFERLVAQLSAPAVFMSAPIPVYGARIRLSPRGQVASVNWGGWDDSAGGRGAALSGMDPSQFQKMLSLLKANRSQSAPADGSLELLAPGMRFSQRPDEADSFHLDVRGEDEGIYVFDIIIGYHLRNERLRVSSDQPYVFMSVDMETRARRDRGHLST